MRRPSKPAIAIAAIAMILCYQNCSEFAVDKVKFGQFESLGATQSAGAVLVPSTDKYDDTCRTNAAFDACILDQNPVSRGGVLPADESGRVASVGTKANYGVKLTSLSGSGKLENSTVSVQSLASPAITTTAAALKSLPGTTGSSAFEQVNVYYWINRSAEYFDSRTNGALPAKGKGIKVVVDDTITGYEAAKNTIRLKKSNGNAVAWNGDIAVHLFGVANVMLANPAGWATLSTTKHSTCNATGFGCCTAAVGCANAIRFGVGDYFAASMFPNRTRIGEAIVNTGNPQIIGGVPRDIASLSTYTAADANASSSGFAQSMGLIYASIWWETRKVAGTQSNEIDRIFLEHLTLLDGNDDFRTAIAKAKSVDARLFSGRHSSKFDTQLTARGL